MKRSTKTLSALCAAALLGAPSLAGAQMNAMSGSMKMTSDSSFAMKAAQGGMTEVKAAQIALQKSKNPAVDAFARKMIADHTPNNAKLASIVRNEGMTPPASVGPMHAAELAKLQSASPSSFDSAYLAGQIAGHKKMLALMQAEAASGKDPKLVAFARMTVPAVEQHLALAQKDASSNS